ncbi:MAG: hypothetical protein H0W76_08715 [Pyrinomonadaceae bacterium]|nr:hypothetical protein [Pyrinomonadaceae bacterium]
MRPRWEIAPNRPHVSRYRFIVHDGAPNKIEIDRLWNDYADPPQVAIKRTDLLNQYSG